MSNEQQLNDLSNQELQWAAQYHLIQEEPYYSAITISARTVQQMERSVVRGLGLK